MKINRGRIIFALCVIWVSYLFLNSLVEIQLLKHYGVCRKGIIMNKRVTSRHSRPYWVYKFEYRGKIYKGNSLTDDEKQIGDSICIVFLESHPSIQRPLNYFDYGETKCSCK